MIYHRNSTPLAPCGRGWHAPVFRLLLGMVLLVAPSHNSYSEPAAQISLPVKDLSGIIQTAEDKTPRFAFGAISATARFGDSDKGAELQVTYAGNIQAYADGPLFVPLLPGGTRVVSFSVNGTVQPLASSGASQGVVLAGKGTGTIALTIVAVPRETHEGLEFTLPSLGAQGFKLSGFVTGSLGTPTVSPTTRFELGDAGSENVSFEADVPRTDAVYIKFSKVGGTSWTIGHVAVDGTVTKESRETFASQWHTKLAVDLFRSGSVQIPLLPESIALRAVSVDQATVPLLVKDGVVHAVITGKGRHVVDLTFDVSATTDEGLPTLTVPIVDGATRSLTATLPGDQDVQVNPTGGVQRTVKEGRTTISAALPRASEVQLSWREAVPEQQQERVSTTASIWHRFRSEEGILIGDATVSLEIKQGLLQSITAELPRDAQVDSVTSPSATVVDWRSQETKDGLQQITVYLDRRVEGNAQLLLHYDVPLPVGTKRRLPLVSVTEATRQRGAVALIGTREAALRVDEEATLTRVGDSGFPADILANLPGKLTYAFKYNATPPTVTIAQTPPQKVEGRFNARLETVVSVGEVGVHGSIEGVVEVKTGRLALLQVEIPKGPQVLSVVAPSLREQRVLQLDDKQLVEIEFTQEMEGSLRFEINYEQLLAQEFTETGVPMVHVIGADVDRGRIAIESRSATEVTPSHEVNLTSEDPAELPTALIARTSHPVLKAYSYVWQPKTIPSLQLKLKRHKKQELPPAKIVSAVYDTRGSMQGTYATDVRLQVANIREQFLRVTLPAKTSFLSVTVDGHPEVPVITEGEPNTYLIKLITRSQGFEVAFSYVTEGAAEGFLSFPLLSLPVLSLHCETEQWTIRVPVQLAMTRVVSTFDQQYQSSYQGIGLSKAYSPALAERTARLYLVAESLRSAVGLASVAVFALLYLALWRSWSKAAAGGALAVGVLAGMVGMFSLSGNVGVLVLTLLITQGGPLLQSIRQKQQIASVAPETDHADDMNDKGA